MNLFDISIINDYDCLKQSFLNKVHNETCYLYNLIGKRFQYNGMHVPEFYPNSVINKWLVTSSSDKSTIISTKYSCLKRCDEKTYYEYYSNEYNPVSILFTTVPNHNMRKYDNNDNLLYDIYLNVYSIDDAGFLICKRDLTLIESNKLASELIELIDTMDIISLDELEEYGKMCNFEINRY